MSISAEQLAELGAYAALFSDPDYVWGRWSDQYYIVSGDVQTFLHTGAALGASLTDFNWVTWKDTPQAQLFREPDAIRTHATAEDLARLFTVAVRQERFVSNSLEGWCESGSLLAMAERAAMLALG